MTRIVFEHAPNLFGLLAVPDGARLTATLEGEGGATYYRAETHDHYVLYRRALSGWGGVGNGQGGKSIPDPRQS